MPCYVASALVLGFSGAVNAADISTVHPQKPFGISYSMDTQQQDLRLSALALSNPLLAPLVVAQGQIQTRSDIQSTGINVDYWINPHVNVFAAANKITGNVIVKFPSLPGFAPLPDVTINADGTTYNAGATVAAGSDKLFGALTYIHTTYTADASGKTDTSQTLIPSVGRGLGDGTINLGLLYQKAEAHYAGQMNVPLLGSVTADVTAENKHNASWLVSYRTPLGSETYLRTSAELGEREGIHLEVSKRF